MFSLIVHLLRLKSGWGWQAKLKEEQPRFLISLIMPVRQSLLLYLCAMLLVAFGVQTRKNVSRIGSINGGEREMKEEGK